MPTTDNSGLQLRAHGSACQGALLNRGTHCTRAPFTDRISSGTHGIQPDFVLVFMALADQDLWHLDITVVIYQVPVKL